MDEVTLTTQKMPDRFSIRKPVVIMDRHKPRISPIKKRTNLPRDNTKLKVIKYLSETKDGATRYNIAQHAEIKKQEDYNFELILDELVEVEWISKVTLQVYGTTTIYKIKDRGREALSTAIKLLSEQHPLSNLQAFKDLL